MLAARCVVGVNVNGQLTSRVSLVVVHSKVNEWLEFDTWYSAYSRAQWFTWRC